MNNQQPPPFLNSQQQQYSSSTPSGGYANVPHPLDPLSSQRMTTSFSSSPLPPLPQGNNAHQHQHYINHQHYQSFNQPSPTLSSGSGSGMNTSGYLSTTGGMPHSHSSSSIASATSSVGGQPPDYMMRSGTVFTAGPGIGSAISLSQQHEAIRAFLKGNDFPIRTPKKLQDIKGSSLEECAELAKSESWKEFLKICEKQVKPPASHRPHDLLQWRLSQLVTLLRLNQTEYAQMCVDDMGDLENNSTYFYEKYPSIYSVNQQNKTGNMMPFTILIIKAILPLLQYLKNPNAQQQQQQQQQSQNPNLPPLPVSDGSAIAMERLYALLKICSDQIKDGGFLYTKRCKLHAKMTILYTPFEGTQEEWKLREQRIVFYIITCHIARKEYYLAIQILEKLLKHYSSLIESDFGTYQRLESLLGCLYLQQGLLKPARDHFVNVEKRETNPERSTLVRANSGYLKFAYGHFVDACKEFTFILSDLDPLNVNAANNRAICMLYMCELGKAIDGVEEFVRKDPAVTLEQNLVYNLCTLYDLESTESSEKKMIISSLAHRFKGDDFGNWIIQ